MRENGAYNQGGGGGRRPRARRRGEQPCQTRENENAVPDT
jgi:hypothetical protein